MARGIPNASLPRPAVRQSPFDPIEEVSEEEIQFHTEEILRNDKSIAERIGAGYARRHSNGESVEQVPAKRHLMYWAKCDRDDCFYHQTERGYIFHHVGTKGPGGTTQVAEFAQNTHATPLPEFGQWLANNQAIHPFSPPEDEEDGLNLAGYDPNKPWGNFKELFHAPGGLQRMPIQQFLQCGFHNDPVLADVRMEEILRTPIYYCEHCPNQSRYFTDIANLNSHSSVMHKAELAAQINSREMGKNISAQTESINNMLGVLINRQASDEDSDLVRELRAMRAELEELKKGKAS